MRTFRFWGTRLVAAALLVAVLLSMALPILAQEGTGVTVRAEANLRLRSTPGTQGQILARIPYGTVVPASAINVVGDWVAVNFNGQDGWVAVDYVSVVSGDLAALPLSDATFVPGGVVAATGVTVSPTVNLRLRAEASATSRVVAVVPRGVIVPALALSADAQWVQTTYDGQTGWLSRQYVQAVAGSLDALAAGAAAQPAATAEAAAPAPAAPAADPYRGLTADFSVEDATTTVTTGLPIWFNLRIRNNTLFTIPWDLIGVAVFQNGVELPGAFQTSWSGYNELGVMTDFSWRDRVYLPGPGQYELRLTFRFADTGQTVYLGIPAHVQMLPF